MCDFDRYGDCHNVHLRCEQCPKRKRALSAGGDEAKKSDGGCCAIVAYKKTNNATGNVEFSETPLFDCEFNRSRWIEQPLYVGCMKSEGGVEGHALNRASNPKGHVSLSAVTSPEKVGIKPGPSDRTDDVTVEELADFLYDNGCLVSGDDEEEGLARAILDAFTVGRR